MAAAFPSFDFTSYPLTGAVATRSGAKNRDKADYQCNSAMECFKLLKNSPDGAGGWGGSVGGLGGGSGNNNNHMSMSPSNLFFFSFF